MLYATRASVKYVNCAACGSEIVRVSESKIVSMSKSVSASSIASVCKIACASSFASASKISGVSRSQDRVILIKYKFCNQHVQS